jgi:hypothetical protein
MDDDNFSDEAEFSDNESVTMKVSSDLEDVVMGLDISNDSEDEDDSEDEGDDDDEDGSSDNTFDWKDGVFIPKSHLFDESSSGVNVNIDSDVEYFKYFVDMEMINLLVTETNRQYRYVTSNLSVLSKRLKMWIDTNEDEMYIFLGICLLFPLNGRNVLANHWSTNPLLHSKIYSETMSRNRFQLILRMLHCSDNEKQQAGDRLAKIKPVLDIFRKKVPSAFYPYQKICIDESLLLFKGRLFFRQYIPSKASRFGIKLFVMCDCKTGYILDIIVYSGATTEYSNTSEIGVGAKVVMSLISPYLGAGHTLYVDNWYTSPKLFQMLHEQKINAVGTVKRNRLEMPKFDRKLKKGDSISRHTDTLMAITWRDKRDVTMLSTIHTPEFGEPGKID